VDRKWAAATLIAVTKTIQRLPALHPARFVEPMQCLAVAKLPEGPDWEYEVKLDGYRALGIKGAGRVQLMSRNRKDFSQRFPSLTPALETLADETVIDGEIVAFDEVGRPSFNLLQNHAAHEVSLIFYAFDLLVLAGEDLRGAPLEVRRNLLRTKVMPGLAEPIRFSETLRASATELIRAVREQGLEGVIAKRRGSCYESGRRSGAWVKMRVNQGQELIIGGYVPASKNFDSIVVGYYEGKKLMYAARVRNGFVPASREAVFKRFGGLELAGCPFQNLPESRKGRWGEGLTAEDMIRCRWLKPQLVAGVEFLEWTPANHLRHPKFIALHEDKHANDVRREPIASEA
jgi:DNA ligase D-like protein (predicted ligase)